MLPLQTIFELFDLSDYNNCSRYMFWSICTTPFDGLGCCYCQQRQRVCRSIDLSRRIIMNDNESPHHNKPNFALWCRTRSDEWIVKNLGIGNCCTWRNKKQDPVRQVFFFAPLGRQWKVRQRVFSRPFLHSRDFSEEASEPKRQPSSLFGDPWSNLAKS